MSGTEHLTRAQVEIDCVTRIVTSFVDHVTCPSCYIRPYALCNGIIFLFLPLSICDSIFSKIIVRRSIAFVSITVVLRQEERNIV